MAAALLVAVIATPAGAKPIPCRARLMGRAVAASSQITARGLVELRDFGGVDTRASAARPFAISPDGRWLALILRRADAETDRYCMGVMLVSLHDQARPRLLDVGGEFISMVADTQGIPDLPNGAPATITPVWSPDGRWLAYLRRDAGLTQAWVTPITGTGARRLSRLTTDARDVRWSATGTAVVVTTRPGLQSGMREIDQEGRSGFHYDARFWPVFENRPRPRLPLPVVQQRYDRRTGRRLPGTDALPAPDAAAKPPGAVLYARARSGARAWTRQTDPTLFIGAAGLHVEANGIELPCPDDVCAHGVGAMWWTGSNKLLFLRSAGAQGGGRDTLFHWDIDHTPAPKAFLDTADALFGCQMRQAQLYCAVEGARTPRHIEAIDVATGARRTVYDPNPDFPTGALGSVVRLRWPIGERSGTYGDLVLPPDHRTGEHHPLIVVQYDSRGFLRGGTGDEIPIFLLAARGFAVLSFQQPTFLPSALRAHDFAAFQHANMEHFAGRRFLADALQTGIDAAIARGVIDADRIGLTGLSDGAITAQFLLAHPNRFRAAALSTCCDDASTAMFGAGLGYRDMVLAAGYPAPGEDSNGFWSTYSLAANAARIRTPLLLQVPDREYRLALETYNRLDLAGAPVDMYVFPDERHIKWHPAHKLAVYDRVLAWFDFWLRDRVSSGLITAQELARWQRFKRAARPLP